MNEIIIKLIKDKISELEYRLNDVHQYSIDAQEYLHELGKQQNNLNNEIKQLKELLKEE